MAGLLVLLLTAAMLVVIVLTIVIVHDATHPVRRSGAYAAVRGLPFDPGDLDLKYEEWTLEVKGSRLPVWEIELSAEEHCPPRTAVFVHDWGESRIDVLADLDRWQGVLDRAVLYDLRGHGDASDGPSWLGNGEEDDLIALVERLRGDDPVVFVGRGLGANIAMAAAATLNADHIAGVIAVTAYGNHASRLRARLRARDYPTWPMVGLAMMWLSWTGRKPLEVTDECATTIKQPFLRVDEWDVKRMAEFVHAIAL